MDKIVVLGTGTALVTNYYNTCFAYFHNNEIFMVDGGSGDGILTQMKNAGIQWQDVHDLFVTHEHTDHLFGSISAIRYFGYLMFANKYEGELRVYCHQELLEKIVAICSMVLRPADREQFGKRTHFIPVCDGETRNIIGRDLTFLTSIPPRRNSLVSK
ncbi:MAG: MBL fold metallo-hydrolase [Eubacteriales bacterium]